MDLEIQRVFVISHQSRADVSHEKSAPPAATSRDSCGAPISDERYSLYSVRLQVCATASGSCSVTSFSVNRDKPLGSVTRQLTLSGLMYVAVTYKIRFVLHREHIPCPL